VLPEAVDWLIYLDSDTVVIRSLRLLWDVQQEMNASHVMAATLNDFVFDEYNKTIVVPIVPPAG
jgi:lipopolysaccharide biosynthesis glycosyltransferase